jgi:hypothetical protein
MLDLKTARVMAAVGAVVAFLAVAGCAETSNREDFASALKNKTEPEVLKYAGKPAAVDAARPERTTWIYNKRTFDVGTRKTDPTTTVVFTPAGDGKLHVSEVLF